ncbi:sugar phosphate isomerase/epimerase family protein [Pareuzebyella sediminis]|uniref:sugar phosphate isomerase/epimerase family protein n=1 Tax=Pareuzebyella sediminis TaxID=2607998 RepID=UPI0011EFADBE|nr:TIM barrel protein [Pareuzebyella sediminis]
MKTRKLSRRKFLGTSAMATAGLSLAGPSLFGAPSIISSWNKPNSLINGVQIGTITYSFRSMPDQSAEATLQYVVDSGISAIELMGDPAESFVGKPENPVDRRAFYGLMRAKRDGELSADQQKELADLQSQMDSYNKQLAEWRRKMSMDGFTKLKKMYNDAGVHIYAFKSSAFRPDNTDDEIEWGMKAAKLLGASHVTVEHPSDDAQTLRLGNLAKKNKIYMAYHGHEQQTPTLWDTALKQSDYNALNLDLGHYVAAGNTDPLGIIKEKHHHIKSMHLKDRQTPDNGKGNLPWGKGDTPIKEALHLMHNRKYKFPGTIELEYEIPEGSNAVEEVKKCLAYCEKVLA